MSNEIIIIVGLPASGKSYLAKQINIDSGGKFKIIDDPSDISEVEPYINDDIIIIDPHLCFEKNRKKLIEFVYERNKNVRIKWIFFENNMNSCLKLDSIRDNKKSKSFIKNFSKYYTIPRNSNIVPCYQLRGR